MLFKKLTKSIEKRPADAEVQHSFLVVKIFNLNEESRPKDRKSTAKPYFISEQIFHKIIEFVPADYAVIDVGPLVSSTSRHLKLTDAFEDDSAENLMMARRALVIPQKMLNLVENSIPVKKKIVLNRVPVQFLLARKIQMKLMIDQV